MRILHLSTGDNRGAFSGAYRLHKNLIENGHDSYMYVGRKTVSDPTVLAPSAFFQCIRFILEKAFSFFGKLIFGVDVQLSRIFKFNVGCVPSFFIINDICLIKPDIIIVYYVADFLSENQLQAIKRATRAEMVFYLMDMGMLTGSCHYAWDCTKYKDGCLECPMASVSAVKKFIRYKWASRSAAYKFLNPVVLVGSEQLKEQSVLSGLTKYLETRKLLIGVNEAVFSPSHRDSARSRFGFLEREVVIYFGAQNVKDQRKGFQYLLGALKILQCDLSVHERVTVRLFTVGAGDPLAEQELSFNHVHLPYINDSELFSQTYVAADVFVCPSVEDSGPMMINESMMSGTPVIAFDIGVAKDLIIKGVTGLRVDDKSEVALAYALKEFVTLSSEQRLLMRENSRKHALKLCSAKVQVSSIIGLCDELFINRRMKCK